MFTMGSILGSMCPTRFGEGLFRSSSHELVTIEGTMHKRKLGKRRARLFPRHEKVLLKGTEQLHDVHQRSLTQGVAEIADVRMC
jgi:hypothetical protein